MQDDSYIDYFAVLEVTPEAKPGDVRRTYKKMMKDLVNEIGRVAITAATRDKYLLDMARLNAAFFVLRDQQLRDQYMAAREEVMRLEQEWIAASDRDPASLDTDRLRRQYDNALRSFLSAYLEEFMLAAGRDSDCVESSHWDPYHERHASRVLRHYRQRIYHKIHERLPFYDVSKPKVDWDERARTAAALIDAAGA